MSVVVVSILLAGCASNKSPQKVEVEEENPHHTTAKKIFGAGIGGVGLHQLSKATGASPLWANVAGALGAWLGLELASPMPPKNNQQVIFVPVQNYSGYSQGGRGVCCGVDLGYDGYDGPNNNIGWCDNNGAAVLRFGKMKTHHGMQEVCPPEVVLAVKQAGHGNTGGTMLVNVPGEETEEPAEETPRLNAQNYLEPRAVPKECQTGNRGMDSVCLRELSAILAEKQIWCEAKWRTQGKNPDCLKEPGMLATEFSALAKELKTPRK